jgi:hypothetical protein
MEYTSLLAGEPFSDEPACVDPQLAAVLRHANDRLPDAHRSRLVPLLGRAIGLVVPGPAAVGEGLPRRAARKARAQERSRHSRVTTRLHRAVCRSLLADLGFAPTGPEWRLYADEGEVDALFWDLLDQPVPLSTSAAYVNRLVARLELLHRCYEEAMADLGLPRVPVAVCDPAEAFAPVTAARS